MDLYSLLRSLPVKKLFLKKDMLLKDKGYVFFSPVILYGASFVNKINKYQTITYVLYMWLGCDLCELTKYVCIYSTFIEHP